LASNNDTKLLELTLPSLQEKHKSLYGQLNTSHIREEVQRLCTQLSHLNDALVSNSSTQNRDVSLSKHAQINSIFSKSFLGRQHSTSQGEIASLQIQ